MNKLIFAGRTAAAPELNTYGDTKVAKFRLIRNEYAGKDDSGQRKEREVSIPFAAFGGMAETLAKTVMTGDQLIVEATVKNNNYEDDEGKHYGFNFEVQSFEYGAPGAEKRKKLAEGSANK